MGSDNTAYSAGHTDAAYARIDSASISKPGYFSAELPYAIVGGTKCSNLEETTSALRYASGDIVVVLSDKVTAADLGKTMSDSESILGAIDDPSGNVSLVVPADADIMLGADCSEMFLNMNHLVSADLSGFNTSRVTNMNQMFKDCNNLKSLNLSSFNISRVTNMSSMFESCNNLTSIFVNPGTDWSGTTANSDNMFYICNELVGGQGTQCDTSSVKDATYARVDGLNGQPGYFTLKAISYYINSGMGDYTGHTGLTAEQALPNIDSALARISGEGSDGITYFLKISGGLTGQQSIGDTLNGKARRIVLEGVTGNTVDSLYGNNAGIVLTVATSVPVEIRNLKITGGKAAKGAGVYVDNANVTIGDGTLIANNIADGDGGGDALGGGVYVGNGGYVRMTDGIISGNIAAGTGFGSNYGAGVCIYRGGTFTMDGGEIINNTSKGGIYLGGSGGGVMVLPSATFSMNAGTISGNIVENGRNEGGYEGSGKGVFVFGAQAGEEGGTFIMGGNAQIASDNDVYLCEGTVITIASVLDNMYVGTITPQSYPESYSTELPVFAFADGVDGKQGVKFKVTPEQRGGKTYYWYTNGGGKISKDQCRINVPNDAAHPYVLTYDSEYEISSDAAGHPEVYIAKDVSGVTTSLSYYVTLDGYKRVSPRYHSSFSMYNYNSGVKFYYHITLEGDNSIQNNDRAPLFYGGAGNAELIFDATSATGGTLSLSVTDASNNAFYLDPGSGTINFKVADGCTFTGTVGETTYSDITEFFNAAKTNSSASFTVKRWAVSENGHQYVDLGLTSGTLWATTNVGATNPQDYGDYIAWSETEPLYATLDPLTWRADKDTSGYSWVNFTLSDGDSENFTKYNSTDGKTILDPEDDAATVNWGSGWATPTPAEACELEKECYWEWTTNYNGTGVAGYIVYKSVDKSKDYNEISRLRKSLLENFPEAFIIAFRGGQKTDVRQAIQEFKSKKK